MTQNTCKRLPVDATRQERDAAHALKMAHRREKQRSGVVGFMPVTNQRIDGAISGMVAMAQINGVDAQTAYADARANVARSLPMRRMDYFMPAKPSKSDSESYRNRHLRQTDGPRRFFPVGA